MSLVLEPVAASSGASVSSLHPQPFPLPPLHSPNCPERGWGQTRTQDSRYLLSLPRAPGAGVPPACPAPARACARTHPRQSPAAPGRAPAARSSPGRGEEPPARRAWPRPLLPLRLHGLRSRPRRLHGLRSPPAPQPGQVSPLPLVQVGKLRHRKSLVFDPQGGRSRGRRPAQRTPGGGGDTAAIPPCFKIRSAD